MTQASNPVKTYVGVYVALLTLLGLSVSAAELDLGTANVVVSFAIAATKAVLIVLFFMHVRHGAALIKLVLAASILWLGIMFSLSFTDYGTRHWEHERQRQNDNNPLDSVSPRPTDGSRPL